MLVQEFETWLDVNEMNEKIAVVARGKTVASNWEVDVSNT